MSSLKNDLNEKQYWRSLSELADTEEFQSYVSKEFADVQVGEEGSVSRRRFMQLMGASVTLAGTPGCWWEGNGFGKRKRSFHTSAGHKAGPQEPRSNTPPQWKWTG